MRASSLRLEDLAGLTFFLLGDRFPGDHEILALFRRRGIRIETNTRYLDYGLIIDQVKQGFGATFAPANRLDELLDDTMLAVSLPPDEFCWKLVLAYRQDRIDFLGQAMIDFAKRRCSLA